MRRAAPFEPLTRATLAFWLQRAQIKKIAPLAAVFTINIILGNVSLLFIPVSFMQTVKSSVPAFTVLLQVFVMGQSFSPKTYLTLIPVVGGVAIASVAEASFSMAGFLAALLASTFTATQAIVSGILLQNLRLDPFNLVYRMSPIALLLLAPYALVREFGQISTEWKYAGDVRMWGLLCISGMIAFLLNGATFLAIKRTSPLTYTVAGNFKVILSIGISVALFGNPFYFINAVGCVIAVAGVLWYNLVRMQTAQAAAAETSKVSAAPKPGTRPLLPVSKAKGKAIQD